MLRIPQVDLRGPGVDAGHLEVAAHDEACQQFSPHREIDTLSTAISGGRLLGGRSKRTVLLLAVLTQTIPTAGVPGARASRTTPRRGLPRFQTAKRLCTYTDVQWNVTMLASYLRVVRQPNGYPIPRHPCLSVFTLGLRIPIPR
jgi:hypothetical protein